MNSELTKAIEAFSAAQIAKACGLKSYQAVKKWEANGFPRTEWTGETRHAEAIEKMSGGRFKKKKLLAADPRMAAAG